jgi:YfiH family protein
MPTVAPRLLFAAHLRAAGFRHAFTTRQGGDSRGPYASLNLGRGVDDDPAAVQANRQAVTRMLRLDPRRHVEADQIHGAVVAVVGAADAGRSVAGADGLASIEPGTVLAVHAADCVTVLLADPRSGAVSAVHAGWRGTAAGIAVEAVRVLRDRFGADPHVLLAALGPSIGPCHYEVDEPVLERMRRWSWWETVTTPNARGRWQLNLQAANRRQLIDAGLPATHIEVLDRCTYHHPDLFYSHRRDSMTGRMAAVIAPRDHRPHETATQAHHRE